MDNEEIRRLNKVVEIETCNEIYKILDKFTDEIEKHWYWWLSPKHTILMKVKQDILDLWDKKRKELINP